MSRTSASGDLTIGIVGGKRGLKKTKEEWENLVLTCLTSKYTGNRFAWGCLSEENLLFQISNLSYTRVPAWVVGSLINDGRIELQEDGMTKGFYKACDTQAPVLRRRRIIEVPEEEEEQVVVVKKQEPSNGSIMAILRRRDSPVEPKPSRKREL